MQLSKNVTTTALPKTLAASALSSTVTATPAGVREVSERFSELDSLRGIAALGIVFWHYNHFDAQPLSWLFQPFYSGGFYMVDFFFVLSGFVLGRAYLRENRRRQLARNTLERIARLYPLHLLTLLLVAAGQFILVHGLGKEFFVYDENDAYHFVLNLFLVNSIGLQEGSSFNGPSWSISVELAVNLLFFQIILFPRRTYAVAFLAFGILGLLGIIAANGHLTGDNYLLGIVDPNLLRAVFGFFIGTVLSLTPCSRGTGNSIRILYDVLFVASIFFVYEFLTSPRFVSDFFLVILAFPALIYAALRGCIVPWFLRLRPLVYVGVISYSIYLMHFPVQLAFHVAAEAGFVQWNPDRVASLAAFFAVTILVSALTFRSVEKPMQKRVLALISHTLIRQGSRQTARSPSGETVLGEGPCMSAPVERGRHD